MPEETLQQPKETLILNDGTVVAGHILENGDGLTIFVYLDGLSLAEGFSLFSAQGRTKHITAYNHGATHEYDGFTHLSSISDEYGNCNIVMKRTVS